MADRADKIVAIFGNQMELQQVLDDLNQSGFNRDEISVLAKNMDHVQEDVNEVRAYSTGTYPSATLERPVTRDNLKDNFSDKVGRGLDRMGMHGAADTVDRDRDRYDSAYNTAIPGRDVITPTNTITGVDAGTAYNRVDRVEDDVYVDRRVDYASDTAFRREDVVDQELIGDKVNVNRDKQLEDTNDVRVKDPNALIKDSVKGGTLGLLAGAAALLIPGVGPVFAAGPIAAAIGALATGAAVGTTAGALVGLFQDEGIPSDRVDAYRSAFDAGKAIVIIKPKNEQDEMTELNLARSILNRHNPEMVELIS